jgi:hypothetical protein
MLRTASVAFSVGLFAEWLKTFFADDFNQLTRITPRNMARSGNVQHAYDDLMIAPANDNLISCFDRVRGFCRASVKQNNPRVAKLLGQVAARAKATQLQKEIKTH